jgi:2,4-dienoyl-CoA reductase-like NADH-dependent reductase (Old Yellow Enzyme family)
MNERIRQLALLHGYLRWDQDSQSYELDGGEDTLYSFAELIVKECIDIVAAGGEFASRPKLVEKLQEHFGIQE